MQTPKLATKLKATSKSTAAAPADDNDVVSSGTSSCTRRRGAFLLIEGVDRCGKTTQCAMLLQHLLSLSVAAVALRFPDRTTSVGTLIDGYLKNSNNLSDRAVHLLFSANRWESAPRLAQTLANGQTIVCDRYTYSGVAFSSAKKKQDRSDGFCGGEDLSVDWCKAPDAGLPAPDSVVFLHLEQDQAEKRGGYGGERYEKRDLQLRVRERFSELQKIDETQGRVPWFVVDASKSIDEVHAEIQSIADKTIARVADGRPLMKMWAEGEFPLPDPLLDTNSE